MHAPHFPGGVSKAWVIVVAMPFDGSRQPGDAARDRNGRPFELLRKMHEAVDRAGRLFQLDREAVELD